MPDGLRCGFLATLVISLFSAPISVGGQDLAWRDRDNRFEGLVEVPNGKRDYELLAFFGYDEVKAPSPDGNLHLMFYLPPGARSKVEVKEIHADTQYAAQFKENKLKQLPQNWWSTGSWPISDVIQPAQVNLQNIGVLIHVDQTAVPNEIAPAVLYTATKPNRISQYSLYFVSNRDLRQLSCFVSQGTLRKKCSLGAAVETSEPTKIEFDTAGLQQGDAVVELDGSLANTASNGRFSARIHFLHQHLPE